jgi:hypothetical protein
MNKYSLFAEKERILEREIPELQNDVLGLSLFVPVNA